MRTEAEIKKETQKLVKILRLQMLGGKRAENEPRGKTSEEEFEQTGKQLIEWADKKTREYFQENPDIADWYQSELMLGRFNALSWVLGITDDMYATE